MIVLKQNIILLKTCIIFMKLVNLSDNRNSEKRSKIVIFKFYLLNEARLFQNILEFVEYFKFLV
jgi:hypothetical protein